jgi:nicotinate-nucleotide adenylyltransferase
MSGLRRIGILGGTLDPIHVGHLDTALSARAALALDRVIVMPSRVPPHRQEGPSASPYHRFAMAALAVNGIETLHVSDEELCAEGPSYTVLTLERLAASGVSPAEIFFITGADAFAEIETWYRYPGVLDLAHFVVVSRPGVPLSGLSARLPRLRARFRVPRLTEALPAEPSIFLVDAKTADVSATEIRRRLRAQKSIGGLVPAAVEWHIRQHGLYVEAHPTEHMNENREERP